MLSDMLTVLIYFIQLCINTIHALMQILPQSWRWRLTSLMYLQWSPHYFSIQRENRSKTRDERGRVRNNNLANGISLCVSVWPAYVCATWLVWAVTGQQRQLVLTPVSVWPHADTHKHTRIKACTRTHRAVPCGEELQPSHHGGWPVAFTSLSKLLDCELVIVIKSVKGVGGKEQPFRGNSSGKQAK